jgi:hypothetical protein
MPIGDCNCGNGKVAQSYTKAACARGAGGDIGLLDENKSRAQKGANINRRRVINDAIGRQHLPWTCKAGTSWVGYSKECAPWMYHFEEEPMARAFRKVFDNSMNERQRLRRWSPEFGPK